jgi:hypothetical protein
VTAILVDSNVLLDVATADVRWGGWAASELARLADANVLVINPSLPAQKWSANFSLA